MKKIKALLVATFVTVSSTLFAAMPDEGMWLPLLLKDYNYADMQRLGCTLTPEQIYSVNNSSLKDAVVQLGGFCTAEIVSNKGLLFTNHHCAFDAIQSHSSVENDYLTDGFWAATTADELPVAGLSVSFLVRMEDVTKKISDARANGGENAEMAASEALQTIEAEASEEGKYRARVKEMFNGNAYYLFVYEVYNDVRLVGAPPSSVGKFGGDTDNWMWPRHTGDFAMLRIYADKDNNPAEYSESNVPFKPKHHLPVSIKGLKEGDYTMIMGYPGSTSRYLTAAELQETADISAPAVVKVLGKKLDLMKQEMDKDDAVRISLASDYAASANYYKYSKGQLKGMAKSDVIGKRKGEEEAFMKWVNADEKRKEKYGNILSDIAKAVEEHKETEKLNSYINLGAFGPGFIGRAVQLWRLQRSLEMGNDGKNIIDPLKEGLDDSFKDYHAHVDQKVFAAMVQMLNEDLTGNKPDFFEKKNFLKAKGSYEKYAAKVFKKSVVTDKARMKAFLANPSAKKLEKDPVIEYIGSVIAFFRSDLQPALMTRSQAIGENHKLLIQGMMEMDAKRKFYPDANSTFRLTYGTVKSYSDWEKKPMNAFTYANEIMAKYKPGDDEFDVPEKLRKLIEAKDYGKYGKDGKLTTCFIHDTDITGGNSGSPVINGNGELVGIAFDGNWESMVSDIYFEKQYVRTISVDIRYALFIIDKYADASHLIDEMTLVE